MAQMLANAAANPAVTPTARFGLDECVVQCWLASASAGAANRMIISPTRLEARSELAPGSSLLSQGHRLTSMIEMLPSSIPDTAINQSFKA